MHICCFQNLHKLFLNLWFLIQHYSKVFSAKLLMMSIPQNSTAFLAASAPLQTAALRIHSVSSSLSLVSSESLITQVLLPLPHQCWFLGCFAGCPSFLPPKYSPSQGLAWNPLHSLYFLSWWAHSNFGFNVSVHECDSQIYVRSLLLESTQLTVDT